MSVIAETAMAQLGDAVWEALTENGFTPAPEGACVDGFDILQPVADPGDHVVVVARFEGALYGVPGTRRSWIPRLARALESAGFAVAIYEEAGEPVAVVAARDDAAAVRAAALVRAARDLATGTGTPR